MASSTSSRGAGSCGTGSVREVAVRTIQPTYLLTELISYPEDIATARVIHRPEVSAQAVLFQAIAEPYESPSHGVRAVGTRYRPRLVNLGVWRLIWLDWVDRYASEQQRALLDQQLKPFKCEVGPVVPDFQAHGLKLVTGELIRWERFKQMKGRS